MYVIILYRQGVYINLHVTGSYLAEKTVTHEKDFQDEGKNLPDTVRQYPLLDTDG